MATPSTELSDIDKLLASLSTITTIRSIDDMLDMFGLATLPTAQKYGIFFGCITFTVTVGTVVFLLVAGGSFTRIAQQEENGGVSVPGAIEERKSRPLLLETLLEGQERMMAEYPKRSVIQNGVTVLVNKLLNVAPDVTKAKEVMGSLMNEDEATADESVKKEIKKKQLQNKTFLPEGYEKNYTMAYRKCQEKPGGAMLSGQPEARFEAYARAYAGCGIHTTTEYRRSYARMYETMACATHGTESKYREHWLERPGDLVGRTVRLEPLEADRHLEDFFGMTNGEPSAEKRTYDPNEVWGFCDIGPFRSPKEMQESSLFRKEAENEAKFAIVEQITDKMLGVVCLTNDNPQNLTISLEVPILKPSSEGTVEPLEACFLLMDRLFALGYRRIQLSIDSMDTYAKKYCGRLGFTQEGMIPKDRIVKESNRDSLIYGMLNSDWSKGARAFLFKKLHGDKAMKKDAQNNNKEAELEKQADYLAKQKESSTEIKK